MTKVSARAKLIQQKKRTSYVFVKDVPEVFKSEVLKAAKAGKAANAVHVTAGRGEWMLIRKVRGGKIEVRINGDDVEIRRSGGKIDISGLGSFRTYTKQSLRRVLVPEFDARPGPLKIEPIAPGPATPRRPPGRPKKV